MEIKVQILEQKMLLVLLPLWKFQVFRISVPQMGIISQWCFNLINLSDSLRLIDTILDSEDLDPWEKTNKQVKNSFSILERALNTDQLCQLICIFNPGTLLNDPEPLSIRGIQEFFLYQPHVHVWLKQLKSIKVLSEIVCLIEPWSLERILNKVDFVLFLF